MRTNPPGSAIAPSNGALAALDEQHAQGRSTRLERDAEDHAIGGDDGLG